MLPTRWLAALVDRVELLSLGDDVAAAARVASLTTWAANQQVIDRARAIGAALAAAGVGAVALKGIGLIDAYPSVGHRPLGDLDLLVAPALPARLRNQFPPPFIDVRVAANGIFPPLLLIQPCSKV